MYFNALEIYFPAKSICLIYTLFLWRTKEYSGRLVHNFINVYSDPNRRRFCIFQFINAVISENIPLKLTVVSLSELNFRSNLLP